MKQQNQQRHKLNILTYQLQRFLVFLIRINVNCQYWSKNFLKRDKKTLKSQIMNATDYISLHVEAFDYELELVLTTRRKNQIWEFYLLHDFVFRVLCFDNRRFYEIANTKMSSRNSKSVSAKGQEASCSLFCGRFLFRGRPASLDSSKPKPIKQVSAGNL